MELILERFYSGNEVESAQNKILLEYLKRFTIEDILFEIEQSQETCETVSSSNISQFSDINMVDYVVQIVSDSVDEINYQYVGYMINKNASPGAQTKYGENHLKMAIQMGLVSEKPYKVTELGVLYLALSPEEKNNVKPKLFLRVPLIQKLLLESKTKKINAMQELRECLSEKTAIRRRSNIRKLLDEISKISSLETQKQIMDNIYWS